MRDIWDILKHYSEDCGSPEALKARIDHAVATSRGEELLERLACAARRDHNLFVDRMDLPALALVVSEQTTVQERADSKGFDYFIEFASYRRHADLFESSVFSGLPDEALEKPTFRMHATYLLRTARRHPLFDKIAAYYRQRRDQWRDFELERELAEYDKQL
jgi:hypothetical protein